MGITHLYELLVDLHDQLIEDGKLVGRLGRRRRRRDLLARVQAILSAEVDSTATAELMEATRYSWARDGQLGIRDGISLEVDPKRLAVAIAELPLFAREAFTLHCREGLDYASIAARLAIPEDAVRRELAAALVALDRALYPAE